MCYIYITIIKFTLMIPLCDSEVVPMTVEASDVRNDVLFCDLNLKIKTQNNATFCFEKF
jgi:hypothetical protein